MESYFEDFSPSLDRGANQSPERKDTCLNLAAKIRNDPRALSTPTSAWRIFPRVQKQKKSLAEVEMGRGSSLEKKDVSI